MTSPVTGTSREERTRHALRVPSPRRVRASFAWGKSHDANESSAGGDQYSENASATKPWQGVATDGPTSTQGVWMSGIAWLDTSPADERRMREIVRLFSDTGTLDDLGIGQVRDGLGDLMFPGTSTHPCPATLLPHHPVDLPTGGIQGHWDRDRIEGEQRGTQAHRGDEDATSGGRNDRQTRG